MSDVVYDESEWEWPSYEIIMGAMFGLPSAPSNLTQEESWKWWKDYLNSGYSNGVKTDEQPTP